MIAPSPSQVAIPVVQTRSPDCTVPGLGENHPGDRAHRLWHDDGTHCDDVACQREPHYTGRDLRCLA